MALIHTCYRITDVDRSVAFYNALGFEEIGRIPIRDEAVNVFMNIPGDGESPRLELTYNFGVDSYDLGTGYGHIAITTNVGAGEKLTPLRRLRIDPPRAAAKASGVAWSLARSLSPRPGEGSCLTWSAGRSCAGSISFVGSRSRSCSAARAWRATRSAQRCDPMARIA